MPTNEAPVADDAETTRLLAEQKKAEARQKIAEAEKAERAAKLPDLSSLPKEIPRGALDVGDKGSAVAALAAHGVLREVADDIVSAICFDLGLVLDEHGTFRLGGRTVTVLMVDALDLARGHATHQVIDLQLTALTEAAQGALDDLPVPPARGEEPPEGEEATLMFAMAGVAALAPLVPILGAALPAVLSAFTTDTTIASRDVEIGWASVASALGRELLHRGIRVELRSMKAPAELAGGVLVRAEALAGLRVDLDQRRTWCRITETEGRVKAELASATERLAAARKERDAAAADQHATIDARIAELAAVVAGLQSMIDLGTYKVERAKVVIDAIDAFLTQVFTATADGPAPIITAALHDELRREPDTYLLYATSVFSGGESIYEKKVGADKAHHLGGTAVSWFLADAEGAVRSSGLHTALGQINSHVGRTPDGGVYVSLGPALQGSRAKLVAAEPPDPSSSE